MEWTEKEFLALFALLKDKLQNLLPPQLYYIEDWEEHRWFSTGGTRAKKYVQNPENRFYYFKRSQFKPATANKLGKDFTYEFWSEIIAYQVGTLLGFEVLRYDIAVDKDVASGKKIVGCLSESMIDADKEELIEGIKYLQGYDATFQPENNALRSQYSFKLIEKALTKYIVAPEFMGKFIDMLVFDSIIGNSDRHQENWAFITEHRAAHISKVTFTIQIPKGKRRIKNVGNINKRWELEYHDKPANKEAKLYFPFHKRFAPIYDSGSSLGRELTYQRVQDLLNDDRMIEKYVEKGRSEIHWDNAKISHFELLNNLIHSGYKNEVKEVIKRVQQLIDWEKLEETINNIDILIPDNLKEYRLPEERKKLIIKLITLRSRKLFELVDARI